MRIYRVICAFYDLEDGGRAYRAGDDYPRPGLEPTAARIAQLSGAENRLGRPLIEAGKPREARGRKKGGAGDD